MSDDIDAQGDLPAGEHADEAGPPPVLLVHGWGGSFAATWERTGFTALLADAGCHVIGVDLLGHGDAPKPHEPKAYSDLTERVIEALPDRPVDAIGFSLGALTLLRCAMAHPHRFRRLVLAGVGRNVFERDDTGTQRILAALDRIVDPSAHASGADEADEPTDNTSRLFAQYAQQPGNDIVALAAVLRRPPAPVITHDALAAVTCPTLVIVGDRDFVHPADELVDALPDARSVVLRNVDHFATPEAFGFIDAALEYLDAVPA